MNECILKLKFDPFFLDKIMATSYSTIVTLCYLFIYGFIIIGTSIYCAFYVYTQQNTQRKCSKIVKEWWKLINQKRKIYITIIPHLFDTATDIGSIVVYWEFYVNSKGDINDPKTIRAIEINRNINCLYLFIVAIVALLVHKIITSIAIYILTKRFKYFLLQLFDLMIFKAIWVNYKLNTTEPSNAQRYLGILEATFEVCGNVSILFPILFLIYIFLIYIEYSLLLRYY